MAYSYSTSWSTAREPTGPCKKPGEEGGTIASNPGSTTHKEVIILVAGGHTHSVRIVGHFKYV